VPRVAPFRGLRYNPEVAGPLPALTAPPYDVISDPRRDDYHAASPYNVVHLDLAEGSTEADEDDNRYARAATLLALWRTEGALIQSERACYYAYELSWPAGEEPAGRIRGVLVALELEPWGGAVLPHEHTMPGPVADRLELLRATGVHLSPIYGTVPGPCRELADLLNRVAGNDPLEALTDEEGVTHRLWDVPASEPLDAWLADQALLIADGHHRYTTALAYRDERHATSGPGPWDTIFAFVVDAGTQTVPVLPYHRVQVTGSVPAIDKPPLAREDMQRGVLDDPPVVGLIVGNGAGEVTYGLLPLHGEPPAVEALHTEVLDRSAPGEALRFTHSFADADAAVRSGEATAAYVLPHTTPGRIMAAANRGERLPRKSTFFWPKPRSGLLFMPLR